LIESNNLTGKKMVIWLIGMSGAGKTAIGQEVTKLLKAKYPNTVFLDGDIVRNIMGNDLGHTIEDRKKNAWRICRLCSYLDHQKIHVVCGILSLFHETQKWNRENIPRYFEVYIRVPFEILLQRDAKGLYHRGLAGEVKNVVGVDLEFPPPPMADLVIDNDQPLASFVPIALKLLQALPWEEFQP
jgi:cytidine diphosphoramidate kinase